MYKVSTELFIFITYTYLIKHRGSIMALFDKAESKVAEAAGKAQDKYGELTESNKHQIEGKAKEIYGKGKQVTADMLETAQDYSQNAQTKIKQNPLTAVAISASVGLIVGFLLGRK